MNEEKLKEFVRLIDKAIQIAEDRKKILKSDKFLKQILDAGWITQDDFNMGRDHIEKEYEFYFSFDWLDNNIITKLYFIKSQAISNAYEEDLIKYPKNYRYGFGMTRGISDYSHRMWADELYDYAIYKACHEVERYFNRELE